MAEEMVSVGCRLPNGLRLEVGVTVSQKGNGGSPFAMVVRAEDYQTVLLRGTNQHLIVRDQTRKPVAVLPNQRDREPYINHNISKAFWDRWCKENAKSWHLATGQIFAVPKNSPSEVKAASIDAAAKSKPIFQALDPSATMKLEAVEITKREEEE
jgi:hypothetical protein